VRGREGIWVVTMLRLVYVQVHDDTFHAHTSPLSNVMVLGGQAIVAAGCFSPGVDEAGGFVRWTPTRCCYCFVVSSEPLIHST